LWVRGGCGAACCWGPTGGRRAVGAAAAWLWSWACRHRQAAAPSAAPCAPAGPAVRAATSLPDSPGAPALLRLAGQHFEIRDEGDWWAAVPRDEWPEDAAQQKARRLPACLPACLPLVASEPVHALLIAAHAACSPGRLQQERAPRVHVPPLASRKLNACAPSPPSQPLSRCWPPTHPTPTHPPSRSSPRTLTATAPMATGARRSSSLGWVGALPARCRRAAPRCRAALRRMGGMGSGRAFAQGKARSRAHSPRPHARPAPPARRRRVPPAGRLQVGMDQQQICAQLDSALLSQEEMAKYDARWCPAQ
jgi:hypothetical protein